MNPEVLGRLLENWDAMPPEQRRESIIALLSQTVAAASGQTMRMLWGVLHVTGPVDVPAQVEAAFNIQFCKFDRTVDPVTGTVRYSAVREVNDDPR